MRPLVAELEARGWTVFWDRRIPTGSTWRSHIGDALRDARCVIVIWSRHSISSRWVLEEADDAQTRGVLVPVLLDPVSPPIGFRSIQAADLTQWPSTRESEALDRLLPDIDAVLGSASKGSSAALSSGRISRAGFPAPAPRRRQGLVLAVMVGLAIGGAAGWYLMARKPAAGIGALDDTARTSPPVLEARPQSTTPPPAASPSAASPSAASPSAASPSEAPPSAASPPTSRSTGSSLTASPTSSPGAGPGPPAPSSENGIAPRPTPTRRAPAVVTDTARTRIGFISNRDDEPAIYVMESDGSDQRRLSPAGGADVALAWSPDGRRIAFSSNRGGGWNLRIMNAAGGQSTRLSEALGHVRPAWSPDGNRLAFASDHEGNSDIYVIAEQRPSTRRRLTYEPSRESGPSWSPDGIHIAFTSDRDGTLEVYVMNSDGSDQRRLTTPPTGAADVAWSPDGRTLAYTTKSGIFLINADGTGPRGLMTNTGAMAPSWSPDSRRLAFQMSARGQDFEVFTVDADGTNLRNLTRSAKADYRPAWSPVLREP